LALENHYLKAQKMYISKMNSAAGADKIWPKLYNNSGIESKKCWKFPPLKLECQHEMCRPKEKFGTRKSWFESTKDVYLLIE
jgi:chitinase